MVRKRLHVLFINSWYPSRVLPTNGDFVQRHAECVALYHKVTAMHVITDPDLKDKNFTLDHFSLNGVDTFIAYLKKTRNPFIKWIRYIRAFRGLIRQVDPYDILHLNHIYPAGWITLLLAVFRGKKYVISEHWTFYHEEFRRMIKPVERAVSRLVARQASVICPVTDELGQAMRDFGLKGEYISVPNVVNTSKFTPDHENKPALQLLHVSNMDEMQKNVSGILNVVKRLQDENVDFKLRMIGSIATKFRSKANGMGIEEHRLELFDQMHHNDLVVHFQKSDAFVLFSEDENLPCVILESFACGTPVISTDVGGISEYFPPNFGRLIPVGDEEALYKAIIELKQMELASRDEMHEYAQRHFSPESIGTQFSNVYYKALSVQV